MLKMTFWSELYYCYAFYIVPNCVRNHHTEVKIDKKLQQDLIKESKKLKSYIQKRHTDLLLLIIASLRYLKGTKLLKE